MKSLIAVIASEAKQSVEIDCFVAALLAMTPSSFRLLSQNRRHGFPERLGARGHGDADTLQILHFLRRRPGGSFNDGAGMPHAPSGRGCLSGDKGGQWLRHVLLEIL